MLKNPNEGVVFNEDKIKLIYLAGGCFWGTEAYIKRVLGVSDTDCGYANGHKENPTYEEVCKKDTGHAETVVVSYDAQMLPLEVLLKEFFSIIDPTSLNKQGGDIGSQYRTGIYYAYEEDKEIIKNFIRSAQKNYKNPIVTEVMPIQCFYRAEEYHQDYLDKNPGGYCHVDLSKYQK